MSVCEICVHKNVCDHESKYRTGCSQFLTERQHGEWIDITGRNDIVCSVCRHKAQIGCIEYCGCCGADMRKSGEAE